MRRIPLHALPALLLLPGLLLSPARGDTITLRNGNVLEGTILRETPDGIELQVESGTLFLPRSSIRAIHRTRPPKNLLASVKKALAGGEEEKALALLKEAARYPTLASSVQALRRETLDRRFDRFLREGRIEWARRALEDLRETPAPPEDVNRKSAQLAQAARAVDDALNAAPRFRAQGRFPEAVKSLEAALAAYPSRSRSLARVAAETLKDYAESTARTRLADAAPLLDRALLYDPALFLEISTLWAASWESAARGLLSKDASLPEALRILEKTRNAWPGNRKIRFTLALALEAQGEKDRALLHFSALAGPAPPSGARTPPALKKAAAKAVEGWAGPALPGRTRRTSESRIATSHFLIAYRCADDFARALGEAAEFHYLRIGEALGEGISLEQAWSLPARLILQDEFPKAGPSPSESDGSPAHMFVTTREGRLTEHGIRLRTTPRALIGPILPHEIGHLVFHALCGYRRGIPLWLHEGFALWCEPTVRKPCMKRMVREACLGGEVLPFPSFLEVSAYPGRKRDLFYGQSFSVAAFLLARLTPRKFIEISRRGFRDAPAQALAFGFRGVEDFQNQWQGWARRKGTSMD
ncbi:MAG: hypothetical protein ACYTHN_12365 [Planctomycetota bacterium]